MSGTRFFPDVDPSGFTVYNLSQEEVIKMSETLQARRLLPRYFSAPLFAMWEITSRCPLQCRHCYNESPRRTDELTPEEALKVADELVALQLFSVCITGGEPTLRKDYFDIVRRLRQGGLPPATITSGWTMDAKLAKEMAAHFEYVQVSLDGPDAASHDHFRGREGSFDRAVNAIREMKQAGVSRISVAFSCSRHTIERFDEMVDLCVSLGADDLRTQYLVLVGRAAREQSLNASQEQYEALQRDIKRRQEKLKADGNTLRLFWGDPTMHITIGAALGRTTIVRITPEGNYSVSPYLPHVFGNARTHRLAEAWELGLRQAWHVPALYQEIKSIAGVDDVNEVADRLGAACIDLLAPPCGSATPPAYAP